MANLKHSKIRKFHHGFFSSFFNLAFQFVTPEKKSGVPPWANNPGAPSWILVGKAGKTSASPTFYRKKSATGAKRASLSKIYGSGPQNWRLRKISEKSEKSRYTNYIIAFVKFWEIKICVSLNSRSNRYHIWSRIFKVKKILKGSLDSIPSPSPPVKIQIMGGKVCLGCKGKTLLHPAMFCLITSSKLPHQ